METKISDRIARIIEELGLNSNSFAKKLNVSSSVIYNILKGNNDPSFKLLSNIIDTFNVNPEYLIKNVTPDETPILCHEKRHKVRHKPVDYAKKAIDDLYGNYLNSDITGNISDKSTNMFFQILNNDEELRKHNDLYLSLPGDLCDLAKFIEGNTNRLYSNAIKIIESRGISRKIDEDTVEEVVKTLSPLKDMLPSLLVAAEHVDEMNRSLMLYDECDIIWPKDVPKPASSKEIKGSKNQS